jgi:cytochrome c peroxidase
MSRRALLLVLPAAAVLGAATFQLAARAEAPVSDRESARVELGRRLFFDPAIGRQGRIGCSSCHDPEHGFSDPRVKSLDETGELPRHSQPLTDLAGEGFHWDGEFDTVRDVIDARVLPPNRALAASAARLRLRLESAPRGKQTQDVVDAAPGRFVAANAHYGARLVSPSAEDAVSMRIAAGARYAPGFVAAFGDRDVTADRIGDALESYLRSLATSTNAYDRFAAGDVAALPDSARRGLELFRGSAGCVRCHTADGPRAAFSDGKFHNTGIEARRAALAADAGRLATHFRLGERGAFKTPSLRDVARRTPYFHDGSAATLADVVRYYDAGGTDDDDLDEKMKPLRLSPADVGDLVAFLEALTGDERAGLGRPTALRTSRLSVHVVRPDGSPAARVRFRVVPRGDRIVAESEQGASYDAVTDDGGDATVAMPAATHAVVEIGGRARSPALPDWTRTVTVVDLPDDAVTLRVTFRGDESRLADRFALATLRPRSETDLPEEDFPVFERVGIDGPGEQLFALLRHRHRLDDAEEVSERIAIVDAGAGFALDLTAGAVNELSLSSGPDAGDAAVKERLDRDVAAIRRSARR